MEWKNGFKCDRIKLATRDKRAFFDGTGMFNRSIRCVVLRYSVGIRRYSAHSTQTLDEAKMKSVSGKGALWLIGLGICLVLTGLSGGFSQKKSYPP